MLPPQKAAAPTSLILPPGLAASGAAPAIPKKFGMRPPGFPAAPVAGTFRNSGPVAPVGAGVGPAQNCCPGPNWEGAATQPVSIASRLIVPSLSGAVPSRGRIICG